MVNKHASNTKNTPIAQQDMLTMMSLSFQNKAFGVEPPEFKCHVWKS